MPVRYAVIGCGSIARHRHIPECIANPQSQLVALVDIKQDRVEQIALQYDTRAFTDYRRMLKDMGDDIDAVVVCGPNNLHAAQTIASFKAGKHVLVEKPMATTRRDAQAMIAAAQKAGKFLMVGQNQRLMPAHQKAKQILASGALGKILTFKTSFKHPGPDGWSIDGAKSWFFQKDAAVMGVTGDLGVHKADLMRWLLDQEFVEVSAQLATLDKRTPDGKLIRLDDNALLILKAANGVIGTIEISWTNYGMEDNVTVIYGQKGVMYLGIDRDYGVIVQYRNGDKELHKVGAMATNTRQVASGVIDALTRSILKNQKPLIDGFEGYQSLNVVLTAMEAAAAGKTLKIK